MDETPAGPAFEPATCSALSRTWSEPLPGTASVAGSWLCLEQRGPWGHEALLESHLDSALGAELAERTKHSDVRVQLIRRPGKHADTGDPSPRRVYLAHTHPARSWMRQATVSDPAELLDLDFDRISAGEHDGWGTAATDPVLLICTNGRRDRCCAVWGRPLVAELGGRHGESLWETTHTGGHRFAPAAVLLPSGYNYGRLNAPGADSVLSSAAIGELESEQCRGRSSWSHRGQTAEFAVREHTGEHRLDALCVESEEGNDVRVSHEDGRRWTVTVHEQRLDPPRANSCGKAPATPTTHIAVRTVGDQGTTDHAGTNDLIHDRTAVDDEPRTNGRTTSSARAAP